MKQNAVVTNFEQDFDADEKAMGRHNIDAASTALVTTDDAGLMSAADKAKLDSIEPQQKSDWNADRGITEILNKPYVGKQFTAVVYEQDTIDDITAKLAGNYNLILVGSNGDFIGQYKYTSATTVDWCFAGCSNVESGALALYNQMSTQTTPPQYHQYCFTNCGRDTVTGAAELAQIPSSWGGTGT